MKLFEVLKPTDVNKMSDEEQIELLNTSPNYRNIFALIKKPSSVVRSAAIKRGYWLMDLIKKPTEQEQMLCLKGVARDYSAGKVAYIYVAFAGRNEVCAVWDDTGEIIPLFEYPTANVIKTLLSEPMFINATKHDMYDRFVQEYFKTNTILMNKWLRYAENMRTMK
jgi:hypothetical protein